ncbi:MAG: hypothetical protein J7L88_02075 [Thermoplasmata archaeon]|nr:hypothetical protein [Thermoplasmata archaeon]
MAKTTLVAVAVLTFLVPLLPAGAAGDYSVEISQTPERPKLSDTMTVTATVSPATNLSGVSLRYALCTENTCSLFTTVAMRKVSEGIYRAEIGPFAKDKGYVEIKLQVVLNLSDNTTYTSDVKIVQFEVEEKKEKEKKLPLSPAIPIAAAALSSLIVLERRRRK